MVTAGLLSAGRAVVVARHLGGEAQVTRVRMLENFNSEGASTQVAHALSLSLSPTLLFLNGSVKVFVLYAESFWKVT